jgi:hypothetical protein
MGAVLFGLRFGNRALLRLIRMEVFGLPLVCLTHFLVVEKMLLTLCEGLKTLNFTIPKATPSGDYLARIEHIGLHAASQKNGAQFYLSCAQITVTGGGSGTPSPLVSFPGAYSATDPGILIQIYWPVVSFAFLKN